MTAMSVSASPLQERLLAALEYPFSLCESDSGSVATLVSWVEDRKIRMLEIDARAPLRQFGPEWDAAFQTYLAEIECPVVWSPETRGPCLSWLLHKAVECEYEDDEEHIDRDCALLRGAGDDGEDAARVRAICDALGVRQNPGASLDDALLECTALVAALNDARGSEARPSDDAFPLGFTTGDPKVDEVAKRLRLFYVSDLRDLQDSINGILVKAQNFVANPVTNSTLGKVGR